MAGEFTLDDALVDSFRFNLSRQIVGEVRGKEIWAMIKADGIRHRIHLHHSRVGRGRRSSQVGDVRDGGRTARHARPGDLEAGGDDRDLIVQLDLQTSTVNGVSQRRRRVAEIIAVEPASARPATRPPTSLPRIGTALRSQRCCRTSTARLRRTALISRAT